MYPSDFEDCGEPVRYTLLAALRWTRQAELVDGLAELLMLAPLLAALEFRCNNGAYRPVMDAIDLLARYAGADSDQKLYAAGEKVPVYQASRWPSWLRQPSRCQPSQL
jgi:hypothetical protein